MSKFIVYSGYIPADYDETPTHTINIFETEDQVFDFHAEFIRSLHPEYKDVVFRVFCGEESNMRFVHLQPHQVKYEESDRDE